MKFCNSCKRIYLDDFLRCEKCNKNLKHIDDINEPVQLAIVGGTERALLTGILTDNNIPFVEQNVVPQGVSNELVTGYDVKLSNIIILVPYSSIPQAFELSKSIPEINNDYIGEMLDNVKSDIQNKKDELSKKEDSAMSPALRTTIKIITAIIFLAVIALVVFGTDYVMEYIKSLFM